MARKAAWEDVADSDLAPHAKPRGMPWGRLFTGLLVVAIATFVSAYYVPLYRAQERLTDQYRELSQRSQSLSDSASKAEVELKSASTERDQLRVQHEQTESAQQDEAARQQRVRGVLSAKLDKQIKKGSAAVVSSGGALVVALDTTLLFQPQRLDLAAPAYAILCAVAKNGEAKALNVSATLAPGAPLPAALSRSFATPWALSAARAAAVAQALVDKCAVSAAGLSATGNGDHDPFSAALANTKLLADRVELVLTSH